MNKKNMIKALKTFLSDTELSDEEQKAMTEAVENVVSTPKLACPFKGCTGVIDMIDEAADCVGVRSRGKKTEIPWCVHTMVCPKCGNPVGNIDIGPSTWVTSNIEEGTSYHSIRNPRTGKHIELSDNELRDDNMTKSESDCGRKNYDMLNPYLKKWAVYERLSSDEVENTVKWAMCNVGRDVTVEEIGYELELSDDNAWNAMYLLRGRALLKVADGDEGRGTILDSAQSYKTIVKDIMNGFRRRGRRPYTLHRMYLHTMYSMDENTAVRTLINMEKDGYLKSISSDRYLVAPLKLDEQGRYVSYWDMDEEGNEDWYVVCPRCLSNPLDEDQPECTVCGEEFEVGYITGERHTPKEWLERVGLTYQDIVKPRPLEEHRDDEITFHEFMDLVHSCTVRSDSKVCELMGKYGFLDGLEWTQDA